MGRHAVQPFVYFVRRVDGEGPVKIGCSQDPARRLKTLMCWAPYPLELVALLPGDEKLEQRFHARFFAQHSHREWFHPSPELDRVIAAVAAGTFDTDTLPAPKRLQAPTRPWTEETKLRAGNSHRLQALARRGIHAPAEIHALACGHLRVPESERLQRAQRVRAWLDAQRRSEAA